MRWRDVDLDGRQITISGSAAFIAGERIEGTTKSGRSRVVSIDAGTVQGLKAHRQRQNADRLAAGEEWERAAGKDDDYVFATT
ncbi:site-specific integrase [Actinoallomurus rhizosphaericola]|uniref:integrase n=1 Tax=Actinoallomurus rhizosphaericola TaxID=2952536 RepID=UPI0038730C39